jgi:predicted transcriptional regulator
MVKVSSIMVPHDQVVSIDENKSLKDVATLILEKKVGTVIITTTTDYLKEDGNQFTYNIPVGFISKQDILEQYVKLSDDEKTLCKDFMNNNLDYVDENDDIAVKKIFNFKDVSGFIYINIKDMLLKQGILQVLVLNQNKVTVGYVQYLDIAKEAVEQYNDLKSPLRLIFGRKK